MALVMQQEINTFLRKANSDVSVFVNCLEKAKTMASTEQADSLLEELREVHDKLRNHREQARKLAGSKHAKTLKSKLADARQRIEHEMQRFKEFENGLLESTPKGSVDGSSEDTNSEKDHSEVKEVKVLVEQLLEDGSAKIDEFKCKICFAHIVGCEPKVTNCCSHLFCGDCMEQWFTKSRDNISWAQRAKAGLSAPCPLCKTTLLKDRDLTSVCHESDGGSRMLYQMLSKTKIMCVNNPKCSANGRCNWTGDYGSYQDHIQLCQNVHLPEYSLPEISQNATSEPCVAESEQCVAESALSLDHTIEAESNLGDDRHTTQSDVELAGLVSAQSPSPPSPPPGLGWEQHPIVEFSDKGEVDDTRSTDASEQQGQHSDVDSVEHIDSHEVSDAETKDAETKVPGDVNIGKPSTEIDTEAQEELFQQLLMQEMQHHQQQIQQQQMQQNQLQMAQYLQAAQYAQQAQKVADYLKAAQCAQWAQQRVAQHQLAQFQQAYQAQYMAEYQRSLAAQQAAAARAYHGNYGAQAAQANYNVYDAQAAQAMQWQKAYGASQQ